MLLVTTLQFVYYPSPWHLLPAPPIHHTLRVSWIFLTSLWWWFFCLFKGLEHNFVFYRIYLFHAFLHWKSLKLFQCQQGILCPFMKLFLVTFNAFNIFTMLKYALYIIFAKSNVKIIAFSFTQTVTCHFSHLKITTFDTALTLRCCHLESLHMCHVYPVAMFKYANVSQCHLETICPHVILRPYPCSCQHCIHIYWGRCVPM